MRIAIVALLLTTVAIAQEVRVGDEMIPYKMVEGKMIVSQTDLAKVMDDLETGEERYDLLDVVDRHVGGRVTGGTKEHDDVAGYTRSDGKRVAGYRRAKAGEKEGPGYYKDGHYYVPSEDNRNIEEPQEVEYEIRTYEVGGRWYLINEGDPDRRYYIPLDAPEEIELPAEEAESESS